MLLPITVLVTSLLVSTQAGHAPRSSIVDLSPRSAAGPSPATFPQKQDSALLSPDFASLDTPAACQKAISNNAPGLKAALLAGKDLPRTSLASAGPTHPTLPRRAAAKWDFANQKIRAVNLGGWLVTEPWITPSLYDATGNAAIVDEWTFGQYLGRQEAAKRLQTHWSTWITLSDIQQIAAAGLNHVRIPIGYWAFDISAGEPYVQGQYPFLLQAITWCRKVGVRVIVDVHGGPGSQNGFDNSGRRGSVLWHTNQDNVKRTLAVVQILSKEFEKTQYNGVVTAVQYLNEPAGFVSPDVVSVYKNSAYDAYGIVHYPTSSAPSQLALSLHDAFQPLSSWQGFMPPPNFESVTLDTHIYTIFTPSGNALTPAQRIQSICNMRTGLATSQRNLYTIVGEWASAPNDCATYLNGRGVGSRYDGTFAGSTRQGSCVGHTGPTKGLYASYKNYLRQYWEVQVSVYEASTSGWMMWTWKAETADDWSYKAGLAGGWIPKDPTQRKFPSPCS